MPALTGDSEHPSLLQASDGDISKRQNTFLKKAANEKSTLESLKKTVV